MIVFYAIFISNPVFLMPFHRQLGIFNITAEVSNAVTVKSDGRSILPIVSELMTLVTGAPCQPPLVSILNGALQPKKTDTSDGPIKYYRSERIVTATKSKLNCSGVLNTRYIFRK